MQTTPIQTQTDPLTALAYTALSAEAGSGKRSPSADRAWAELDAAVQPLAARAWRRACARHGWRYLPTSQAVRDFLADAPGRIFRYRALFLRDYAQADRDGRLDGLFARWVEPVLMSGFAQVVRDTTRRAARQREREQDAQRNALDESVATAHALSPAEVLRHQLASDAPLSEADLRRIAQWPLHQRVVLPLEAGFEHKVPQWVAYVAEADLKQPFPPPEYRLADERDRRQVLADAMGVSRDLIYTWWSRGKTLLRTLELFQ
jgi:hypothetical protein